MHEKHIFLRVFSKITIFACVFCAFFISPVFATLPAGYTELEYIESTGTQYIDTGVDVNDDMSFETVAAPNRNNQIGVWQSGASGLTVWQGSKEIEFRYRSDANQYTFQSGKSYELGTYYNIGFNIDGRYFIVDDAVVEKSRSIDDFGTVCTDKFAKTKKLVIYVSGTVVRNLIPAKRYSDSAIGMYDTVSGTFFTNLGTGTFIAGPEIAEPISEIKIATTKYVDEEFAAAEAKLATTVQTIESVVSRTIDQAGDINRLQAEKQTRPDESCPANMKCLLVQDEDGTPHWYPIIEP